MTWISEELSDLAGAFYFVERQVSLPFSGAPASLCVASPLRWALLVGPAASSVAPGPWAVSTVSTFAAGQGFGQQAQTGIALSLHYRAWGPLVQQAWYGRGLNSAVVVTVLEMIAQQ